jgi:Up-regulated During Septation
LTSLIQSTNRKLTLEQKVKQAAQSLHRLETAASKRTSLAPVSSNHLDIATQKCEEISAELWRLSSRAMEVERKLMNHNAAVLGMAMTILERKSVEGEPTDEFGEGHLYVSNDEDQQQQITRLSISGKPSLAPSVKEAQNRLWDLNATVATMAGSRISTTPPEDIVSHVDQLTETINLLTASHSSVTRDLQTSVAESQRMIEQLRLRERDQSAAIVDHTSRTEDLERRLIQTQIEFDRAQNQLELEQTSIENLRKDIETARAEALIAETSAQGREAESLRREKSLRRGETERFTNDMVQKDRMVADLSRDLDSLRQEHEATQQLAGTLQLQLDNQSQDHDIAIRDLETQLVMLKSETAMLKAEKDELLGSRQQRAEEARIQKELEEHREKYVRGIAADDTLAQEIEQLKKRNSQLIRDLQLSESERITTEDTLDRQIHALESQLSSQTETFTIVDRTGTNDTSREKALETRCAELETELSSILDDFERLTSQFIDHESFRQSLELQIDVLRNQCHVLQTELAEDRVRHLGRNDISSPVPGGFSNEQTSTGTLRTEFRKMVAEMRNEHITSLKVLLLIPS